MIRRPPGRLRIDPGEPKIGQIELLDEHVDRANRVQAPMSPAQIKAKFDVCAAQAINNSAAEKIYAMLSTIGEQPSFAEFWPLLRKG
jgi:hypothetical protein